MTDNKLPEIKELLKYKAKVGCQNCDLIGEGCCSTCVNSLIKQFIELFDRLQAENERLQGEVAKEFVCFVGDPHKVEHCPYLEELKTAKAEAYKEFAKRLKEKVNVDEKDGLHYFYHKQIDNLLKELVGEDSV